MSGIFGILRFDNVTSRTNLGQAPENLSIYRGPDGTFTWQSNNIFLGHHALHTTKESLGEQLPFYWRQCELSITSDARIDNRNELISALNLSAKIPDSQIILAVYEKWGIDGFSRLIGDFAFVIWDGRKKKLICVRDFLGVKPFFYHVSDHLFIFNSDVKPIVLHPQVSGEPNEGIIGEYLAKTFASQTETLFRDVSKLAPAHYMIVEENGSLEIRAYWQPDYTAHLSYKHENDYVEHFQEIFTEAVQCRLRSHLPVSFELSGGLDSSSIVGVAHSCFTQRRTNDFAVYSLIYPRLTCNEYEYIESVRKHLNISVSYIDASNYTRPDWQEQVRRTFLLPDEPNLSNSDAMLKDIQSSGSRVLLTGIGGDEWFTGSKYLFWNLLKNGYIGEILRDIYQNKYVTWKDIFKRAAASTVWPFISISLRSSIIRSRHNNPLYPPWINPALVQRIHLENRLLGALPEPFVSDLSMADFYRTFSTGYESYVLEANERQKATYHIEVRHPFLDRRLAEFALALPHALRHKRGMDKHLMRLAGESYLPCKIRNRWNKAEFSQLFYQSFCNDNFQKTLRNNMDAINKWIFQETFYAHFFDNLDCFHKNNAGPCPNTRKLWFVFAITLWYSVLKAVKVQSIT